ncbi:MAG: prephenate dehydrogenase/arogenate dehydrogenase family protein [Acidimicrobiales bacterium]
MPADEIASAMPRVATVVGLGLIGGSVALALRDVGYRVSGHDADAGVVEAALAGGVIDAVGVDGESVVTVVATPVDTVPKAARDALKTTRGWVLDTGSVKGRIAGAVDDPRFVPTHPMAGSEQAGLAGSRADLFRGAAWVLAPSPSTSDDAFAFVHDLVVALGADPVTVDPDTHDRMVATVSHVPHLTAAALMNVADSRANEHLAMLRLAAGGFRDMTRIAAGSPEIWPSICTQNRGAISDALVEVIDRLGALKAAVDDGDERTIRSVLTDARRARTNLPVAVSLPESVVEVRVRIKDERGELAALTTLAAELDVNIYDLEIAHSAEGPTGVIVLVVDKSVVERFRGGLLARGYRPSVREMP